MSVNKVTFNGKTLIDLSNDTINSSNQLAANTIGHTKYGEKIIGTAISSDIYSGFYVDSNGYLYLTWQGDV